MDYKELAARTHLDERRIKAVIDRDFDALKDANVPMTLKILEREAGMDFTSWKEEYELWRKEHICSKEQPKIAPKVQGFCDTSHKESNSFKIIVLIIIIIFAAAAAYYHQEIIKYANEMLEDSPSEQIEQIKSEQSSVQVLDDNNFTQASSELEDSANLALNSDETASLSTGNDEASVNKESANEINEEAIADKNDKEAASNESANEPQINTNLEKDQGDKSIEAIDSNKMQPAASTEIAPKLVSSTEASKEPAPGKQITELRAKPDEEDVVLKKPASLSIIPKSKAWISIKNLATGKSSNFTITSAYKLKAPSLVFIGTTAYRLEFGTKKFSRTSRYFIFDDAGVKFLNQAEYAKLNKGK